MRVEPHGRAVAHRVPCDQRVLVQCLSPADEFPPLEPDNEVEAEPREIPELLKAAPASVVDVVDAADMVEDAPKLGILAAVVRCDCRPAADFCLEVGRAGTSCLIPDRGEHRPRVITIGLAASFAFAFDEVDHVLAGVTGCFHDLVENVGLLGGICNLVALPLDLDALCF